MSEDYPSGESDTKQIECPICDGTGKVSDTDDKNDEQIIPCYNCKGTGQVEISKEQHDDECEDREADLEHDDI